MGRGGAKGAGGKARRPFTRFQSTAAMMAPDHIMAVVLADAQAE